jgi:hypothetical protein
MHVYGSILAEGRDTGDWDFFMGQTVATWVEETVLKAAWALEMPERTRLGRVIGYLWTVE